MFQNIKKKYLQRSIVLFIIFKDKVIQKYLKNNNKLLKEKKFRGISIKLSKQNKLEIIDRIISVNKVEFR